MPLSNFLTKIVAAAAFPLTHALATPGEPAFHQVLKNVPKTRTAAATICCSGFCENPSKLDGQLTLLL